MILILPGPLLAAQFSIPNHNITLTYPDDWQSNTSHEKGSLVLGGVNLNKQTGLQFRMYHTKMTIENFIDWYVKDYIKQMEGHWQGSDMEFTQITKPNLGKTYYTTSFTYKQRDGTVYIIHHYFWPLAGKIFVILGGVPETEQLQHELKFDYVAQSVRFH